MTLKEFYRKEKYCALHAQSRRFRIVKYCVLLGVAGGVYAWKGWSAVGLLFLLLFLAGIGLHFFFRWKTEAWTKSWGLYKRIPFEGEQFGSNAAAFSPQQTSCIELFREKLSARGSAMNEGLLFLHFVGLMLGATGGFASAVIMRRALVLPADEARVVRGLGPILANVSLTGLVVMWATGLILVWSKWSGIASLPDMFWVKGIFILSLTMWSASST